MTEASIAVVNTISNYPFPLTDRWGDYTCRSTLLQHWSIIEGSDAYEAYEHLRGRYESGEMDSQGNLSHLSIGDPRAFQHDEAAYSGERDRSFRGS